MISFFIINDTFGLYIYLCGRENKNQEDANKSKIKNQKRKVKPVYLPKGGTKY